MYYPMMDDADPLLIRAREAGNWNSIHEPPRLTPPAHLMFDPDTVAENTMRLDELESKMEMQEIMINLELEQLLKKQHDMSNSISHLRKLRKDDRECVQLQLRSLAEHMADLSEPMGLADFDSSVQYSDDSPTSEAEDGWTSGGTSTPKGR